MMETSTEETLDDHCLLCFVCAQVSCYKLYYLKTRQFTDILWQKLLLSLMIFADNL